jgi:hypothetical protein
MEAAGTLELFAVLSVSFAGFSGLSAVLRGSTSDVRLRKNPRAIRNLVEFSLFTLIYSVIPLVLLNLGLPESAVWRIAAAIFSFSSGIHYYFRFSELLIEAVREDSIGSFRLAVALHSVIIISLVASAFRAIDIAAGTLYIVALLWNLIAMAIAFLRHISPAWAADQADASPLTKR